MALRARAREDDAVAAACLLDALGYCPPDNADAIARGYVGAMVLVDASRELTLLRKILVKALSSNG